MLSCKGDNHQRSQESLNVSSAVPTLSNMALMVCALKNEAKVNKVRTDLDPQTQHSHNCKISPSASISTRWVRSPLATAVFGMAMYDG